MGVGRLDLDRLKPEPKPDPNSASLRETDPSQQADSEKNPAPHQRDADWLRQFRRFWGLGAGRPEGAFDSLSETSDQAKPNSDSLSHIPEDLDSLTAGAVSQQAEGFVLGAGRLGVDRLKPESNSARETDPLQQADSEKNPAPQEDPVWRKQTQRFWVTTTPVDQRGC